MRPTPRHRSLLLGLALAALPLACDHDQTSEPGTEPDAPSANTFDGGNTLSAPPPATCETVSFDLQRGHVAALGMEAVLQPRVSGGSVLLHLRETAFSNAPSDLEIYRVDPWSEAPEQLTANDVEDTVLDARDGAMLVRRLAPGEVAAGDLIYMDPDGEQVVATGSLEGLALGNWDTVTRGQVAPGAATWSRAGEVFRWDAALAGGAARSLWTGDYADPPRLAGADTVWSAVVDGQRDVYLHDGSQALLMTDDATDDAEPVLIDEHLVWLSDGHLAHRNLATGVEDHHLVDHHCAAPVVGDAGAGPVAATRCVEDPDGWGWLGPIGGALVLLDLQTGALSKVGDPARPVGPMALDDGLLAWVSYSPDADACAVMAGGAVHIWEVGGAIAPTPISLVGVGCFCCSAAWPSPVLDLDGGLLAWNYHMDAPGNVGAPGASVDAIGFAQLTPVTTCDR